MRHPLFLFFASLVYLCFNEPLLASGWQTVSLPFRPTNLTTNDQMLWVCGADEMLARSDDGGRTWKVKHQKKAGELLLKVVFAGKLFGFASGTNGVLLRTTDGGETWNATLAGTTTVTDISFADATHGMRQIGLAVELTDDAGLHWTAVGGFETDGSKGKYYKILSFARLDSNRAAIALHQKDGENFFLVTSDGGKIWKWVHLDNTFAGTLVSRNSEYWAFGIEYLEREISGGYSAPVVLHSADGANWTHGVRSPFEFNSCTAQGCILYDGAIATLYSSKPSYLAVPADGTLQNAWATALGSVCVAGTNLKCASVEKVDTPSARPVLSRPISTVINESKLFADCLFCKSGTFAVPNTVKISTLVDVAFTVSMDGTVFGVEVHNPRPTSGVIGLAESLGTTQSWPPIRAEIQNIIGDWLFIPPRNGSTPIEETHRFVFHLNCFAFPDNDQGTCSMMFLPKH